MKGIQRDPINEGKRQYSMKDVTEGEKTAQSEKYSQGRKASRVKDAKKNIE